MAARAFTVADKAYLRGNYLTLAELCSVRPETPVEVEALIEQGMLPRPSYVLEDGTGLFPTDYFRLADEAGGPDKLREHFARRYREARKAAWQADDELEPDWEGYMAGVFGVCLRDVTPETIVRKDVLVSTLCELLVLARPHRRDWRDALRTQIDELDAIERSFAPDYDRGEEQERLPTRDLLINAARDRYPDVFRRRGGEPRQGHVKGDADVAAAAALLAEPARAAIVLAVMEQGALSASELAARAQIARSTASEHLARLVGGGFLTMRRSGRHRYYDIADDAVAEAVEALSRIAPQPPVRSLREATRSELIREARTCYDHLAGRLGVALARALEDRGVIVRDDGAYLLGPRAKSQLEVLGIAVEALGRKRRPLVRGCLDWSERELHLAGALGAAIAARLFELGCLERADGNRSVKVTTVGRDLFRELGVDVDTR